MHAIGGPFRQHRIGRVDVIAGELISEAHIADQMQLAGALQFIVGHASSEVFRQLAGLEVGEQQPPLAGAIRIAGFGVGETVASVLRDDTPKGDPVAIIVEIGLEIGVDAFEIRMRPHAIVARLVPSRRLHADEHAEHDDDEVYADCRPFLTAKVFDHTTQQHRRAPAEI